MTGIQGREVAEDDDLALESLGQGIGNTPAFGQIGNHQLGSGLSDSDLEKTWDVLVHAGGDDEAAAGEAEGGDEAAEEDADAEPEETGGGGGKVKLKPWNQRHGKSMGFEAPGGKAVPLIDRIHRVMHLWKDGDVQKVDEYLDQHALRRNELFRRVVQSLIELSTNSERSLLESISNHIGAKGAVKESGPELFQTPPAGENEAEQ